MEGWRAHTARFSDVDDYPLCPGAKLLGGVEASEAGVLACLRRAFCNDRLFVSDPRRVAVAADFCARERFGLLEAMSGLLGAQVRSLCEPLLLTTINSFAALLRGTDGRRLRIESPFFTIDVFVFPAADAEPGTVVWLGWARWGADMG